MKLCLINFLKHRLTCTHAHTHTHKTLPGARGERRERESGEFTIRFIDRPVGRRFVGGNSFDSDEWEIVLGDQPGRLDKKDNGRGVMGKSLDWRNDVFTHMR